MVARFPATLQVSPRERLYRLDRLLDQLERLNLTGQKNLPVRIGDELRGLGLYDVYNWQIPELIERVFELQEPLLTVIVRSKRSGFASRLRPPEALPRIPIPTLAQS
jgi:hypothetical protein